MRPALFRMNVRVFTVFLIVGLVMLAGASYFVVGTGQARLRSAWGEHLAQVADHAAAAVDAYVYRQVIDASVLARVPEVREEASAGSRQPFDPAAVGKVDRDWQQGGAPPASVGGLLATKTSSFLADVSKSNPIYKELLLTDCQGRLVAASGLTTDYFQADESWWKESFGDGIRGQLAVSDVRWDESAKMDALEISVPVEEPAGGGLAGVLKVLTDIRDIGAVLGGLRLGTTGDGQLLREDGSFVLVRPPVGADARFFAGGLLQEHLQVLRKGEPRPFLHFGARSEDGTPRVIGVATSQLRTSYPHLAWLVAVSQTEDELFAPLRAQATSFIIVLCLITVAVLVLALWASMTLAAPSELAETEMHLVQHPRVHRMEEEEEEEKEKPTATA